MTIGDFQRRIVAMYTGRDRARGRAGTFMWFIEEVGELAEAIREGDMGSMREEFADVLAWLVSVAALEGVDLEDAVTAKYGRGCPTCGECPCRCKDPSRELA